MSANLGAWNEDPAEVWDREHRDEEDRPRIEPHHQPGRPGGRVMAECFADIRRENERADDEAAANAKLYAEAPAMAEALRKAEAHLHRYVEAVESGGGSASQSEALRDELRAILARIEGDA